ncbi:hypothetical protein DENSPDRAFT_842845 [Dentipellis sp. KUC8613]|nr:hypothetical protein DENSPDRAFT_842845 [Dentipellis sp. KUC8613]
MSISIPAMSASEYWCIAEEKRFVRLPNRPYRSWEDHSGEVKKALALEMDAVSMVMCSLRARFNAVAHVNRLPPEILAHVFSLLQKEQRDATWAAQLAALTAALPLAHLELIIVDRRYDTFSAPDWFDIFGRCTEVCEVIVKNAAAASLCEALMRGGPVGGPLFPTLRSLTLQDDMEKGSLRETLLNWLWVRQGTNPVERIDIQDCRVRRATIESIREDIPDVLWDENGIASDEGDDEVDGDENEGRGWD